jgi:4-hydroxy-3-methylbut-2-enyl diphosphate reductase|tara:strand:+ start:25915 stop:26844 length:930 start_codon:yes stop_codon:yes gene_type:complete
MKKKIYLIAPRGFCAGVTRAVDTVTLAIEKYGAPVYVKHEIVHNKHVIDELKDKGAIFIEDLNDVPNDRPLIFSAHGVSKKITNQAKEEKNNIIDATCPLVTKVHIQALKFYNHGYEIILIGHKNHPEVEGTMGQVPEDKIMLVENVMDVKNLKLKSDKIAYITQTTLSVEDTNMVIQELKKKFPHIESSPKEDICYATTNRQNAVKEFASNCDAFIIVGSNNSSNSNRLVEVAKNSGCLKSNLVEDAKSLNVDEYRNYKSIGISSGASVPDILVMSVIEKLKNHYELDVEEMTLGNENVTFRIPSSLR